MAINTYIHTTNFLDVTFGQWFPSFNGANNSHTPTKAFLKKKKSPTKASKGEVDLALSFEKIQFCNVPRTLNTFSHRLASVGRNCE